VEVWRATEYAHDAAPRLTGLTYRHAPTFGTLPDTYGVAGARQRIGDTCGRGRGCRARWAPPPTTLAGFLGFIAA
jgi:hypothetical protein